VANFGAGADDLLRFDVELRRETLSLLGHCPHALESGLHLGAKLGKLLRQFLQRLGSLASDDHRDQRDGDERERNQYQGDGHGGANPCGFEDEAERREKWRRHDW
jgi:hypothetical protein